MPGRVARDIIAAETLATLYDPSLIRHLFDWRHQRGRRRPRPHLTGPDTTRQYGEFYTSKSQSQHQERIFTFCLSLLNYVENFVCGLLVLDIKPKQ